MLHLRVFDISHSGQRVVLRERADTFHVAAIRGPCQCPVCVGELVCSSSAGRGPHSLRSLDSGRSFTANFESVDCSLGEALHSLQAQPLGLAS